MTLLAFFHPDMTNYVNYLYQTRQWWAYTNRIWQRTYGFQYSDTVERWFSSIEKMQEGTTVPIAKLPELLERVVSKRHAGTYEKQRQKLKKELPVLRANLVDHGLEDLVKLIEEYVGSETSQLKAQAKILSVVSESLTYEVLRSEALLTETTFKEVGYEHPNASAALFTSLLEKRVAIEENLRQTSLFANHEDPAIEMDAQLFVVRQKSGKGHPRLLLYFEGALACDCPKFHQNGFWCKHAFCLYNAGRISFSPTFAIDSNFAQEDKRDDTTVIPPIRKSNDTDCKDLTKNWRWATRMAAGAIKEGRGARLATTSTVGVPFETSTELAKAQKAESRRQVANRMVTLANSHPEFGARFDELARQMLELADSMTQTSRVNKGREVDLNPLAADRRCMHLAENKTSLFS